MKSRLSLIASIVMALVVTIPDDPARQPDFQHPVIKDHGGIVVLSSAEHQPQSNSKVLLDISSDEKSGSVIKGLDRAALIVNLYNNGDVKMENALKMTIVLHGTATKAVLSHEAYAKHAKPYMRDKGQTTNPDLELLQQLNQAGVDIFVCGQALAHQSFAADEVMPEVKIAVSAATVNINLQMENYAYLPFH